jgi:predicted membrane protein
MKTYELRNKRLLRTLNYITKLIKRNDDLDDTTKYAILHEMEDAISDINIIKKTVAVAIRNLLFDTRDTFLHNLRRLL